MRDTYYTLNAFNSIGHFEEVEKYFSYIHNIILEATDRIRPMYTVTGAEVSAVRALSLHGYMGNQPVRLGNDASFQIQNDVYGQVLVSLLPLFVDHRLNYFDKDRTLSLVTWLLNKIDETLEEPDAGLWEFNNIVQLHSYTLLFHWAGGHSAFKIANLLGEKRLSAHALRIINKASGLIEKCYDRKRKVYTQAVGTHHLDATGLQLITMNYLDPSKVRTRNHLSALEKDLKTPDGLFYRYKVDDFGKPQTSFLMCAFWYAEALACVGRVEEGYDLIEKLISYSNHLGLYSEDSDFEGGQWGNFPQAYSHVGLMNAVYRISVKQDKPFFIDHSYHD
jgi:GH15 family glucan-1,4-alpha-glucosidase